MSGQKWTENEIEFLKENYGTMSANDLAIQLNRTKQSVQNKIRSLNPRKKIPCLDGGRD